LLRPVGVRLEHRAAGTAQRCRILPQARHNPIHIRYLIAAKPHHIGRARHPLFPGSAVFLRGGDILNGGSATSRYREAQDKPLHSHRRVLSLASVAQEFHATHANTLSIEWDKGRFVPDNKM
jgi:hypothetical protein